MRKKKTLAFAIEYRLTIKPTVPYSTFVESGTFDFESGTFNLRSAPC